MSSQSVKYEHISRVRTLFASATHFIRSRKAPVCVCFHYRQHLAIVKYEDDLWVGPTDIKLITLFFYKTNNVLWLHALSHAHT